MRRVRFVVLAFLLAATSFAAVANAQTIAPPAFSFPLRFVNGQNEGYSTRPAELNPYGVSYADCMADMTLQFSLTLSGFTGSAHVEVWASASSNCVALTDRAETCWSVSPPIAMPITPGTSSATVQIAVRVQDLVGWQNASPAARAGSLQNPMGPGACTAQASSAAVPMTLEFLALDADENAVGVPYQHTIQTDLVGPPAPVGLCESVGDTVYNLTFTPNTDLDTVGYDVYLDPLPGEVPADSGISLDAGSAVVCPGASNDPGGSACVTVLTGSSLSDASGTCASSAICGDPALAVPPILPTPIADAGSLAEAGSFADAHVAETEAGEESDGGLADDAGVVATGGISAVPVSYLVAASPAGTINDRSIGQYQVTGLVDFVLYNAAVAAVDGTGNIGPPSSEVCDYPAPIGDFWRDYQADGGGANGYCALDAVGAGGTSLVGVAGAVVAGALARRRRTRRR